jgi:putative endonuclease
VDERHAFGLRGESWAASFLEKKGLRIVERRFRTPFGEIDLIARDRAAWVFVEVKSRMTSDWIGAIDAITAAKRRRLLKAAFIFIKSRHLIDQDYRWDLVFLENGETVWIPNAWMVDSTSCPL